MEKFRIPFFAIGLIIFMFPSAPLASDTVSESEKNSIERFKVEGKGCFIFGDNDTPSSAKETALAIARRNAIETYKVFLDSSSTMSNFVLEQDVVNTLATGYLYDIKIVDTTEMNREVCVTVEGFIKPQEFDRVLNEKIKMKKDVLGEEITGDWGVFMEKPAVSTYTLEKDLSVVWRYDVPTITDETYAGLDLNIQPVPMKGRKVVIQIQSEKGYPIHVRFYSFSPDFSKDGKEETWVPVEKLVRLKTGSQQLSLEPDRMAIPEWWYEENDSWEEKFQADDVRMIEFGAVVDEALGPVSDTLTIETVTLR